MVVRYPTHTFACASCGDVVSVYRSASQLRKAQPKFCSLKCIGVAQAGKNNPAYNGGRYTDSNGYVHLHCPGHPNADCRGYVYEHRFVASVKIGRPLLEDEVVHHCNGVRDDNNPDNLEVLENQSAHVKLHREAA